MGYTLRQFRLYLEAVEKLEQLREKRTLACLRASQFGADDYKKFIKSMFSV